MRKLVFILLTALGISSVQAQEVYSSSGRPVNRNQQQKESQGFDPSRLIFGGGMIFGIGGGMTNIGISPVIGYRLTDRFSAGIGLSYQYVQVNNAYSFQNPNGGVDFYTIKDNIYSGSIWARYFVFNNFFLHVEPEMYSRDDLQSFYYDNANQLVIEENRIFVPALLLGAGIRQPISDRVGLMMSVLYDVLQDPNSPYVNTVDIRIGVFAGF